MHLLNLNLIKRGFERKIRLHDVEATSLAFVVPEVPVGFIQAPQAGHVLGMQRLHRALTLL